VDDVRIRMDGRTVAARRYGPADSRPTIVLLHQGLGSVAQWKGLPADLADHTGLPVFAYDRFGPGRPSPFTAPVRPDYLPAQALHVLPAVLAAARIERPLLVGHSDGGTIALLYGAAHPDGLVGAVVVAAHVFVEDATVQGVADADRAYEVGGLRAALERHHGAGTDALFRRWADTWQSQSFRSWDVRAELAAFRAPLVVVQGADDPYGTTAQVEAIAAAVAGPCRPVVLPGVGHDPFAEASAATLDVVAAFVPRCGATDSTS